MWHRLSFSEKSGKKRRTSLVMSSAKDVKIRWNRLDLRSVVHGILWSERRGQQAGAERLDISVENPGEGNFEEKNIGNCN